MVITGLTRNQVVLTGSWVRIPPLPPLIKRYPSGCLFIIYTEQADSGGIRRRPCIKSKRQLTFKTKSVLRTDFRESAYKAYNESRCYQTTCNSPSDSAYTASAIDKRYPSGCLLSFIPNSGRRWDSKATVSRRCLPQPGSCRNPNLLALYVANNRFFLLHMSCIDIIVPV